MSMKRVLPSATVITFFLAGAAWLVAGDSQSLAADPPAAATGPGAASRPVDKILKFPNVMVDLTKRQVVVESSVCRTEGFLELLLCRTDTKEHESILHSKALSAHLHACLLALGLTPGIPAYWSGEEDSGQMLPPRGPELKIVLRWKDKDGKSHEDDPADWVMVKEEAAPTSTQSASQPSEKDAVKLEPPKKWVFVGSEITPKGQYFADIPDPAVAGHMIALTNWADAVIDVPFLSNASWGRRSFSARKENIPSAGTEVEIVITPLEGAEKSLYARAMLEIDHMGQYTMEGKPVALKELGAWGQAFIKQHEKGQVVFRVDPRATIADMESARFELRQAGVRSFRQQYLPLQSDLLPRTEQQVRSAMEQWKAKFASPKEYIVEPAEDADATLQQISDQLKGLEASKALLLQYQEQLRKATDQYKASTQPAN